MRWRRPKLHLLVASGALYVVACLPFPHTVQQSPAITGVYHYGDGTPVTGAPVVLSAEVGDRTCSKASLQTVTDLAGRFEFPEGRRRYAFVLLLPIDALHCYNLCGGTTPSDALHQSCSGRFVPRTDSLVCRLWITPGQPAPPDTTAAGMVRVAQYCESPRPRD